MLHTLAIENYRSLRSIVVPLGKLNIIKGVNGSGKSNLYKSLRLLADTAMGGVVSSLAREGGLKSTIWAGPEKLSRDMRRGRVPVQGNVVVVWLRRSRAVVVVVEADANRIREIRYFAKNRRGAVVGSAFATADCVVRNLPSSGRRDA